MDIIRFSFGVPALGKRFGDFELDHHAKTLTRRGRKLRLAPQLVELLTILVEQPGETIAREQIQQRLWPDRNVEYQHSVDVLISQLRLALGDSAINPQYIQTVPRKGYRFLARIQEGSQEKRTRMRRLALYAAVAIFASVLSIVFAQTRYNKFVPHSTDMQKSSSRPMLHKVSPRARPSLPR